jgi:hypothetical protein
MNREDLLKKAKPAPSALAVAERVLALFPTGDWPADERPRRCADVVMGLHVASTLIAAEVASQTTDKGPLRAHMLVHMCEKGMELAKVYSGLVAVLLIEGGIGG